MVASRGIGGLSGGRSRPPIDTFKRLYGGSPSFSGLFDLAVLGAITLAFLDPHAFVAPFEWVLRLGPTRSAGALPAPTPGPPPPTPASPPASQGGNGPNPAPAPTPVSDPPRQGGDPAPAPVPAAQGSPPGTKPPVVSQTLWPELPLVAAPTPGLTEVSIPFSPDILGGARPSLRSLVIDDRSFGTLPPGLKEKVDAALTARYEQRWDDVLAILAGVDPTSGPVRLLLGLAIASKGSESGWQAKAEEHLRAALAAGEPQAATFLGSLLNSGISGFSGTTAEGQALLSGAAASGERAARLVVGLGFLNGGSGVVDPPKALEPIRQSALAGEPLALLHYARLLQDGMVSEKNPGLAEAALRRAAAFGLTEAETILGRWTVQAYLGGKVTDPAEGIAMLQQAAAQKDPVAENAVAVFYNNQARTAPWNDQKRGFDLLVECGRFKVPYCHNNLGFAYQFGHGVGRDVVQAWAHYDVGRQLNPSFLMRQMGPLDTSMLPDEKIRAHALSQQISATLLAHPQAIPLQRPR